MNFINNLTEIKGLIATIILGVSGRVVNPTLEVTPTAPLQILLWLTGVIVASITIFKFFQNQWRMKKEGDYSIFNVFKIIKKCFKKKIK